MVLKQNIRYGRIIKTNISALTFEQTIETIEDWVSNKKNNYVCVCNTHSVVTASNDSFFEKVLNNAGICTADGMPLVWALKLYGYRNQNRVDGPNLMLKLCERSNIEGYKLFLLGGTNETLIKLENKINKRYSKVNIVGKYSPPFRKLNNQEEDKIVEMINATNADIIFVSLGCPKQEKWMYNHRNDIKGVMLGVGAAFEYIIGNIKRPPKIFQFLGLEWAFRMLCEPRRLWKRYAYNNPVFVFKFLKTYKKNKTYTIIQNNLFDK
ncbi:MAG: WecB/TagA/CpsF family glycosyltransferase [Weizmannia coagulans]|jgi:N-acetylglucosaminyldiphosphoundecaprenol N-acetyl-beta-D-mannosaminyltransferase|uniref:WecB/TagA/CpsF family glycosyltransferase n=1 Tax=Heyndrickxia coagulans TaxID=1398 RepID=UPI00145929C6|nr:WecB/TagA/CpsF family glycosyltransferase [Heyndrickxia coagulans]MCI1575009.1 WecB/TagA/CpsF family glycosyltransferase [Heyndrickxia coagulans]NMH84003.1 WecB/TagA/CpsF family glycosyltransferase [Heyndrickxia coagulans]